MKKLASSASLDGLAKLISEHFGGLAVLELNENGTIHNAKGWVRGFRWERKGKRFYFYEAPLFDPYCLSGGAAPDSDDVLDTSFDPAQLEGLGLGVPAAVLDVVAVAEDAPVMPALGVWYQQNEMATQYQPEISRAVLALEVLPSGLVHCYSETGATCSLSPDSPVFQRSVAVPVVMGGVYSGDFKTLGVLSGWVKVSEIGEDSLCLEVRDGAPVSAPLADFVALLADAKVKRSPISNDLPASLSVSLSGFTALVLPEGKISRSDMEKLAGKGFALCAGGSLRANSFTEDGAAAKLAFALGVVSGSGVVVPRASIVSSEYRAAKAA